MHSVGSTQMQSLVLKFTPFLSDSSDIVQILISINTILEYEENDTGSPWLSYHHGTFYYL